MTLDTTFWLNYAKRHDEAGAELKEQYVPISIRSNCAAFTASLQQISNDRSVYAG